MSMKLAKDDRSVRLQVGPHKNDSQDATLAGVSSFNLDGSSAAATSNAMTYNTVLRVAATSANIWVKNGATASAVTLEGTFISSGSWDHISLAAGDKISVIGGLVNIVPIKD
jgi:hypothetical protein